MQHERLAVGKVDELLHLALEALGVIIDVLLGQHLAHIGTAGGVADKRGAVADKRDGLVSCHLKTLHEAQCHEVADVQRIRGAVKADVERGLAVVHHVSDLFFVCHLSDKPSGNEFFVNTHFYFPP